MRFGVGDFSGQRPPGSEATHRQLYAELLDQAHLVEQAGLDSMWVSEHHFADDGYMPSVLPIAAALLARTARISVGTDRLAASLQNPIRVAADALALDLLSGGRVILGLSLCYRQEEFRGFGIDPTEDADRLEALVPALRDAFAGRELAITPGPFTDAGPPLMIAADGDRGAARAGRLADLMMIDPTEPWEAVDRAVDAFDQVRGNSEGELVMFTYGAVSEQGSEAAWREIASGFRYMRHTYDRWMGRELTAELPPRHYRLLLGTPEEVAGQAIDYARRFGDRAHLVLRANYPGMAAASVAEQIRLWGRAAEIGRGHATRLTPKTN